MVLIIFITKEKCSIIRTYIRLFLVIPYSSLSLLNPYCYVYAFSVCLKYERISVTNRGRIALRHLKYHKIMVIMNKLQLGIRSNILTRWLKKCPIHITAITHAGLEYSRAIISVKTEKKPFSADIQIMSPNYPLVKMDEGLMIEAWLLLSLSL